MAVPDRDIPRFAKIISKNLKWTKYAVARLSILMKFIHAIKDFKLGVVLETDNKD